MPLDPASLTSGVLQVLDAASSGSVHGTPELAELWGDALRDYFTGCIGPPGLPTRALLLDGAREAAVAALGTATVPTGIVQLQAAVFAFAGAIVASTAPPIVATPPPVPLILVGGPVPNAAAATAIAVEIDTWARTGLWIVPLLPPAPWA